MSAKWEQAYEDWARLLESARAEDLLRDPRAVWDEAWRQAVMTAVGVAAATNSDKVVKKLEELLK